MASSSVKPSFRPIKPSSLCSLDSSPALTGALIFPLTTQQYDQRHAYYFIGCDPGTHVKASPQKCRFSGYTWSLYEPGPWLPGSAFQSRTWEICRLYECGQPVVLPICAAQASDVLHNFFPFLFVASLWFHEHFNLLLTDNYWYLFRLKPIIG